MAREPDGITCWGRFGNGSETYVPPLALSTGAWHHVEFWVKLNAPGGSDAVQTFWVDGVQRGNWAGFSFRSSAILKLNSVQLTFSNGASTTQTQKLYVDDLVVSTQKPEQLRRRRRRPAAPAPGAPPPAPPPPPPPPPPPLPPPPATAQGGRGSRGRKRGRHLRDAFIHPG
jgi:hypothetical protein